MMKYRTLPGTDLSFSEIGFGVWTVATDWWGLTDPDLRATLLRDAVVRFGITHINTAPTYGDGFGEIIVRQSLADLRDQLTLATKFGYDLSDTAGRPGHRERRADYAPQSIRRQCEDSLRRLGTDRIDLYEAHNPRLDHIDHDDIVATLHDLRDEGKIRCFGVSLGPKLDPARQIDEGLAAIDRGYHCVQMIYNLLEQTIGQTLLPAAEQQPVGLICRVPHSSGLLEGNLTAETVFPPTDHRSHRPGRWLTEGLKKIEQLDFLTADGSRTLGQAALQFVLRSARMLSALPNIYNHDNLREFAAAAESPALTDEQFDHLQQLYADHFGLAPTEAM